MADLPLIRQKASETVPGEAQFATQAEVNTGAAADKIITPATLAALSYGVLSSDNGAGSINTQTRKYNNAFSKGGVVITQSLTLGDSITVLENGLYEVSVNARYSPASRFEVMINAIVPGSTGTWPDTDSIMTGDTNTGSHFVWTRSVELIANDIIRMTTLVAPAINDNGPPQYLSVVRVK